MLMFAFVVSFDSNHKQYICSLQIVFLKHIWLLIPWSIYLTYLG